MGLRLERAIDEVNRIERKIMMYQNQKKEAMARLKLVENEEIVRSIRAMNLSRDDLVGLLKGLQDGTVTFSDVKDKEQSLSEKNIEEDALAKDGYDISNEKTQTTNSMGKRKEQPKNDNELEQVGMA